VILIIELDGGRVFLPDFDETSPIGERSPGGRAALIERRRYCGHFISPWLRTRSLAPEENANRGC
jgi:hypothetical protein